MCGPHYSAVKRGTLKLPDGLTPDKSPVATTWQEHAACRGMNGELFFPVSEKPDNPIVQRARAVCAGCPVVLRCAEWALNTNLSDGIFGGLTSIERRRIRNAAKVAAMQQIDEMSNR
jgi:WhiB family redox-sensing transcriptional regulator